MIERNFMFALIAAAMLGVVIASTPDSIMDDDLVNLSKEYYTRTALVPLEDDVELVRLVFTDMNHFCDKLYNKTLTTCDAGLFTSEAHIWGICYYIPTPFYEKKFRMAIELNDRLKKDPLLLENVLWHELGHCVHGLDHDKTNAIMTKGPSYPINRAHLESQKRKYINYLQRKKK